jgi:hypothetical protein
MRATVAVHLISESTRFEKILMFYDAIAWATNAHTGVMLLHIAREDVKNRVLGVGVPSPAWCNRLEKAGLVTPFFVGAVYAAYTPHPTPHTLHPASTGLGQTDFPSCSSNISSLRSIGMDSCNSSAVN